MAFIYCSIEKRLCLVAITFLLYINVFAQSAPAKEDGTYSINTGPIHICFIMNGNAYAGFILAGHAERAICAVASLEIASELQTLGYTTQTIFTYGVAFDLRPGVKSTNYNIIIRRMHQKFRALQREHPEQVVVTSVRLSDYQAVYQKIRSNYQTLQPLLNNDSLKKDHIFIQYRNIPHPLIVPFYSNNGTISFIIPQHVLDSIPKESLSDAAKVDYRESAIYLDECIEYNRQLAEKVRQTNDNTIPHLFQYFDVTNGNIDFLLDSLGAYPWWKVADKFSERKYTLEEARALLYSHNAKLADSDRQLLQGYVNAINRYQQQFPAAKQNFINRLATANRRLTQKKEDLRLSFERFRRATEQKSQELMIDAFLRGWRAPIEDSSKSYVIDKWYEARQHVWDSILQAHPAWNIKLPVNSTQKDSNVIAGIFQNENVFFVIKKIPHGYLVTPLQMIGGHFIQIIDKHNPIPQLYTYHNFRYHYLYKN